MRCVKLTYQKRWDFLHSSKILSISCCLDLGGPRASAFIWFFHAQLNIFNYVEVGALCWPWQDTDLTDNQVNFGKYCFVRGCIVMLGDEWLPFLSKHCLCSLKQIALQFFHILFCIDFPSQTASVPTPPGPTDPQNMTDVEFETFGTKDCGFSFLLVFLQTLIVLLSFDNENQHSSEKNNILPVFQLPVSPGFGPLNTFFLFSNETNGFLFLAWRIRIAVI